MANIIKLFHGREYDPQHIEFTDAERCAKYIFEHQQFGDYFALRNEDSGVATTIYCDTQKRSYEHLLKIVKYL